MLKSRGTQRTTLNSWCWSTEMLWEGGTADGTTWKHVWRRLTKTAAVNLRLGFIVPKNKRAKMARRLWKVTVLERAIKEVSVEEERSESVKVKKVTRWHLVLPFWLFVVCTSTTVSCSHENRLVGDNFWWFLEVTVFGARCQILRPRWQNLRENPTADPLPHTIDPS